MNKFILPLIFIFVKFIFIQLFSMPWPVFEPVIGLALIYTFFHSLDIKRWLLYAFYCGLLRDIFSLEVFGFYLFSCVLTCLAVSFITRIIYRQNWVFIFPVVFFGIFLSNHIVLFFKVIFLSSGPWISQYGWVFSRTLLESLGTTLLVYPLYLFLKKCAPELIG